MTFVQLHELLVLDQRDGNELIPCWQDFLCIERLTDIQYELSIRIYEVLGCTESYLDKNGILCLPEIINGKTVIGVEDEFIVGGTLIRVENEISSFKFTYLNLEGAEQWLKRNKWDKSEIIGSISSIVKKIN